MISVVTITFNNFSQLCHTLESIENLEQVEKIVINGGGCTKTQKYLEEEFDGIFLSEPDRGISDAFNKGIELAKGKGIIFLNSGDLLIDKDYFKAANKLLDQYEYIYSDIYFLDLLAGKIRLRPTFKPLGRGMPYPHQTLIVKREIFNQVGNFSLDYKIAMDFDFVCRLKKASFKDFYYEKPTVLMEGNGISIRKESQSIQECKAILQKYNLYKSKNYWNFQKRKFFFLIRQTLLTFRLNSLLAFLKQAKYH